MCLTINPLRRDCMTSYFQTNLYSVYSIFIIIAVFSCVMKNSRCQRPFNIFILAHLEWWYGTSLDRKLNISFFCNGRTVIFLLWPVALSCVGVLQNVTYLVGWSITIYYRFYSGLLWQRICSAPALACTFSIYLFNLVSSKIIRTLEIFLREKFIPNEVLLNKYLSSHDLQALCCI